MLNLNGFFSEKITEHMSPLYVLKVSVLISFQALNDIHLTLVTYWPKLREMCRTHVHGRL